MYVRNINACFCRNMLWLRMHVKKKMQGCASSAWDACCFSMFSSYVCTWKKYLKESRLVCLCSRICMHFARTLPFSGCFFKMASYNSPAVAISPSRSAILACSSNQSFRPVLYFQISTHTIIHVNQVSCSFWSRAVVHLYTETSMFFKPEWGLVLPHKFTWNDKEKPSHLYTCTCKDKFAGILHARARYIAQYM